jgi:pantoate--beta-alanine ligase
VIGSVVGSASEQTARERSGFSAERTDDTVQIHRTIEGFRKALDAERAAGRVVGLVPTMGYLHDGHASLMRRAAAECDVVAATIFVNPLQFAANEDLSTYPRDLDGDARLATASGVSHLFVPSESEMYPDGRDGVLTTVHVVGPSEGLEGASRPTHFDGVATVVAKLFAIAGPCRAYFGEKDWQQLLVVRRLVHDLSLPIEVVGCPIIREDDGLAMSSRNVRLSDDARTAATVLHRALLAGRDHPADPEAAMRRVVATEPLADLDYAAVRDGRLLIAARFGSIRLIDNLEI